MKRLFAALTLLVLTFSICIGEMLYTENAAEQVEKQLYSTITFSKQKEQENAETSAGNARAAWEQYCKVIYLYTPHNHLDSIGERLVALPVLARQGNWMELEKESVRALAQIRALRKADLPYLENIM